MTLPPGPPTSLPAALVVERDLVRGPTARIWVPVLLVYPTGFEYVAIAWTKRGFAPPQRLDEAIAHDRDIRLGLRVAGEDVWMPGSGRLAEVLSSGGSHSVDARRYAVWCAPAGLEHEMALICEWRSTDLTGSLPLDSGAVLAAAGRASRFG